jgi:hypothetical protein
MHASEWVPIAASGLSTALLAGCCGARTAAPEAPRAAAVSAQNPADVPAPDWKVDFDFESAAQSAWTSEWGQIEQLAVVELGDNKLLEARWNPSQGFDLTTALGPPKDLTGRRQVCFHLYVPKVIAEAGYAVKIWMDDTWPSAPQTVLSAVDSDRWRAICADVGGLSGVNLSAVNKVGIYLEPGPSSATTTELAVVYLDNVGLE